MCFGVLYFILFLFFGDTVHYSSPPARPDGTSVTHLYPVREGYCFVGIHPFILMQSRCTKKHGVFIRICRTFECTYSQLSFDGSYRLVITYFQNVFRFGFVCLRFSNDLCVAFFVWYAGAHSLSCFCAAFRRDEAPSVR